MRKQRYTRIKYTCDVWDIAVHLAVTGGVFDGVLYCVVHEMFWMRYRTELSQFLRIFLSTFDFSENRTKILTCDAVPHNYMRSIFDNSEISFLIKCDQSI